MKATLLICASCRPPAEPREPREARAGNRLLAHFRHTYGTWAEEQGLRISSYECLSVCPRPCGVALRAAGKFTYVFGDLDPDQGIHDLKECAALYLATPDGFLPREKRPLVLQRGILARVPPW